jgi:thymidylate kinase
MKVCYCGIDGVGKTTRAKRLKKELEKKGDKVVYVHLFSPKASVGTKYHHLPIISNAIRLIRKKKNCLNLVMRLINVLIDSWLTALVNNIKYQGKTIIYDRYFYDVLVIIAKDFPKNKDFILSFACLLPRPDKVFILDKGSALYKNLAKKLK